MITRLVCLERADFQHAVKTFVSASSRASINQPAPREAFSCPPTKCAMRQESITVSYHKPSAAPAGVETKSGLKFGIIHDVFQVVSSPSRRWMLEGGSLWRLPARYVRLDMMLGGAP